MECGTAMILCDAGKHVIRFPTFLQRLVVSLSAGVQVVLSCSPSLLEYSHIAHGDGRTGWVARKRLQYEKH